MKQVVEVNGKTYDTDFIVELVLRGGFLSVTYYDPILGHNLTDVYVDDPTYKIRLSDSI